MTAQAVSERPRSASAWIPPLPPAQPRGTMPLLLLGCLAVAAVSLTIPSAPTYDSWAWLVWGREILHLDLVTLDGPSWKPLPVLFTTPFALFGDDGAPALWLVVSRAGGLLAFAMVFRLGTRLAGPWAGAIATVALLLSDAFLFNIARGTTEGMLVAAVLWGIERHLDGHREQAFLLGFAAALLRPEVWPFWGLYGLWLLYEAWDGRPPWREIALVFGLGVLTLALWLVPEYLGSGDWLRAAERAREPNPGAATFAKSPFFEVFRRSGALLSLPVFAGAFVATAIAVLRRDRLQLALAATATLLTVGVALMTEGGFAGNLRYLALPTALVCVLAGAGWVEVVRGARRWAPLVAVALAVWSIPYVSDDIQSLKEDRAQTMFWSNFYGPHLKTAIAAAGGEEKLKACGRVFSGPFQVPALAWRLHMHTSQVEIYIFGRGTALSMGGTHLAADPRYPVYSKSKTTDWVAGSSCGRP
ncbi:MAG TPA: hypothetical protein VFX51_06910 [Solirubrobacteraceae bacterium]|nr:hypothetical protein [Solirubrobacteraceae bacterium]